MCILEKKVKLQSDVSSGPGYSIFDSVVNNSFYNVSILVYRTFSFSPEIIVPGYLFWLYIASTNFVTQFLTNIKFTWTINCDFSNNRTSLDRHPIRRRPLSKTDISQLPEWIHFWGGHFAISKLKFYVVYLPLITNTVTF